MPFFLTPLAYLRMVPRCVLQNPPTMTLNTSYVKKQESSKRSIARKLRGNLQTR